MKTPANPASLSLLVLALGCSSRTGPVQTSATSADESALPELSRVLSPGRWALLPEYGGAEYFQEDSDGTRRVVASGVRLVRRADGALTHSSDFMPVEGLRALPLPRRLGGGTLFVGERASETLVWRADDWTSPLQPLARVTERVEAIVVGFDRLYLELPLAHRWGALDLDTGEVVDLTPLPPAPGYGSMAFADAWFGAVTSNVLGVLATFDAGASWQGVEGVASDASLQALDGDIVIESGGQKLRLAADGKLRPYASASGQEVFSELAEQELGPPDPNEQLQASPTIPPLENALRDAVLYGWPTQDGHALVATGGSLARVRLDDGAIVRETPNAYPGDDACLALPLGAGLGFVCNPPARGTTLYAFEPPLELRPVRRFVHARKVRASGNGAVVVSGSCDEAAPDRREAHCVRHVDGTFSELNVRGDVGVERLVVARDASVLLLVPPRLGSDGSLTRIVGDEQQSVRLELPGDEQAAAFLQTGMWLDQLVQTEPGEVGTWVVGARGYRGVVIDADGTVESHTPPDGGNLTRAVFHGSIAFEASPSGLAWTSTNFGRDWSKLIAPPGFYPLDERSALANLGPSPRVGCSRVGCAYGTWLRIGYPPPGTTSESADGGTVAAPDLSLDSLREAELPQRVNFNPPSSFEWQPRCTATGKAGPAAKELAARLGRLATEPPRRGLATGFLPALLGAGPSGLGSGAVFRPFGAVEPPRTIRATLRFDQGNDGPPAFRAYAWASSFDQWPVTSAWQVRVASRFGDELAWATAPTFTPWPDAQTGAELFGVREGTRSGADWSLELDPDEDAGILRIGSPASTELHVLASGRATQSYGAVGGIRLAGAVRIGGSWYYGQHEGDDFRVVQLTATGPAVVGTFNVPGAHRASLVRTRDASRFGVLVRTRTGDWHLYPVTGGVEVPLSVSRDELNRAPRTCADDEGGWWVVAATPLSRIDAVGEAGSVSFEEATGFRAKSLSAKVLVRDGSICVSALAADLVNKSEPSLVPPRSKSLGANTVPLTLDDPFLRRHVHFRCSL